MSLRGFGFLAGEGDFNRFDAAICDASIDAFLVDGFTADGRVFLGVVLDAFDDFAANARLGAVWGDFLRDFLDIRLPFVAFGGSIIKLLRAVFGKPDSRRRLGKSDRLGVWLQGIRRFCPLVE